MSKLQNAASAGEPGAVRELLKLVTQLLEQFDISVGDLSRDKLAYEVFKRSWGLDVIHDLYCRPDVYEVRVDRPDLISVSRRGKNEIVPGLSFKDDEHVRDLVGRLIRHDLDAKFDESHPQVQSVLKDGSRLTAFRPPLTEFTCFVLRKTAACELSRAYLIETGTVNDRLFDIISLLARYGGKILFLGPPESGKTSWVRFLISLLPQNVRTVSIEKDRELLIYRHYPGRSIVELEEHPQVGGTPEKLFAGSLRLGTEMLVYGEYGQEEVAAAITACERARRVLSTTHFETPEDAIYGTAELLLQQQGASLRYEAAVRRVLRAFNTFITVHGDTDRGIKKVLTVTNAWYDDDEQKVVYRTLARWNGNPQDYWEGNWEFPETPPPHLLERMRKFGLTNTDLDRVGWL